MTKFTTDLIEEAKNFYEEPAVENYLGLAIENYLGLALVTRDIPRLGKRQFAAFCKEAADKVLRDEYSSFAQIQNELNELI